MPRRRPRVSGRSPRGLPSGATSRAALALGALLAIAGTWSACLFRPCAWDARPSSCALEGVTFDPPSAATMTRDVVNADALYRVRGPHGETTLTARVWHQLREGEARESAEAAITAYFERHRDLPCSWGKITSGTCAPHELRMPMPGCRDQRSLTCYAFEPAALAR